MKLGLVGPNAIGDMAWFAGRAARHMGWDVAHVDSRRLLGVGLPGRAARRLSTSAFAAPGSPAYQFLQSKLLNLADWADFVMVIKGDELSVPTIMSMKTRAPIVSWYSDHPFIDQAFDRAEAFTRFYVKDTWSRDRLIAAGLDHVELLAHCSDPELLRPRHPYAASHDVSVLGSSYAYRDRITSVIASAGFSVTMFGTNRRPSLEGSTRVTWQRRPKVGRAQGEAFRTGLVTLNTHHPKDVAGANQRLFDAAAAGTVQLTEPLVDSLTYLSAGKHVLAFGSTDALLASIEWIKAHVREADEMSRAALEVVRAEHTYSHRLGRVASGLGLADE
jgi:hypothetical protein